MKMNAVTPAVLALLASIAVPALAVEGGTGRYQQQPALAQAQSDPYASDLYGYAVNGAAERAVTVGHGTRYLNVARLETVRIDVDGKSVTWKFDTLDTRPFALSKILPGFDSVTVYVSESPLYLGG